MMPDQSDFYDDFEDYEDGVFDAADLCGRWDNGRLGRFCTLAGTAFCDFECPLSDDEAETP